ncbi:phenazine biosynthesis protein PhzF family [Lonsdalea britannica]|uniref:PhzF family phenazine biosynthesis protein n=1 Tax=Lonsdalea britannica TaxID=1082704 RepID=UPI000A1DBA24|nr:PhzF family phenazine biosynthesis protein [Lonsdalea britannica]OSN09378.1 phenazine biosynthesis protein PhzF family [Lonsdalea britannica]
MSSERQFKQVDVFTHHDFQGNPLAVILDAEGLSDEQMQAIARWTNLSETTFVLPPTDPTADYLVRIFTPSQELPFAGHPTLGTAHALLEAGLTPHVPGQLIQQCGVGLIPINLSDNGLLAFRAPEATIDPVDASHYALIDAALGSHHRHGDVPPTVVNMGISWMIVRMDSAASCLGVRIAQPAFEKLLAETHADGIAIYGPHENATPTDYEVRAFFPLDTVIEDPVTGSANACIARALQHGHDLEKVTRKLGYSVRQGTMLYRNGRVNVAYIDSQPWIGGYSRTLIDGTLNA